MGLIVVILVVTILFVIFLRLHANDRHACSNASHISLAHKAGIINL